MDFTTPIACLVSTNVGGDNLVSVKKEIQIIKNALKPLEEKNFLHLPTPLYDASGEMIFNFFRDHENAIQIFHFAGHANGEQIKLNSGGGYAEGLSGLLGSQKNLAFVFLNGCESEEQAQLFLNAGVKVVLATKSAIIDTDAMLFAEEFYKCLASGKSVLDSYKTGTERVAAQDGKKYRKGGDEDIIYRSDQLRVKHQPELPWRLFVKEGCRHHLNWKCSEETAFMERLREGSKAYYEKAKIEIDRNNH